MANFAVNLLIQAKDQASSVFDSVAEHAKGMAATILAFLGIHFLADAINDAKEFERQMDVVAAVSGATAEELKTLENAAKEMGATTQYTALEAAQALESLARAGLTASQQVEALPAVLQLAQANGLELGDSADYITKAVAGMGLQFSEAGRVADVLTKAAASANTSVEGLGVGLAYAAPTAQALGLTLEGTIAYMSQLANAGIDASRAGTSLNGMMIQFNDPASKFNQELAELGINTTDFNVALRELAKKGDAGKAAILSLGSEAGPALQALLNQGIPKLDELNEKLNNSAGAAKAAADIMSDNLDGSLKGLGSAWDGLRLQLAQPILEPLSNAVDFLTGKLQQLNSNGLIANIGDSLASVFATFDRVVRSIYSSIADFSKQLQDIGALEFFKAETEKILTGIGASFEQLKSTASNFFKIFSDATPFSFTDAFTTSLATLLQTLTLVVTGFTTGLATIESLFFGVSGVVAAFFEAILTGTAKIQSAIASITFGDVSARWQAEAEKSKLIAESFAQSAETNFDKASQAFDRAAESAAVTYQALDDLGSVQTLEKVGNDAEMAAQKIGLTANELDALGEGVSYVNGEVVKLGDESESTAGKVGGIANELGRVGQSADDIKALASAFKTLGITSSAELKKIADQSQTAFNRISDDAGSTAQDIKKSFLSYAKAAIEANNGVASSAIVVKASQLGVTSEINKMTESMSDGYTKAQDHTRRLTLDQMELHHQIKQTNESIREQKQLIEEYSITDAFTNVQKQEYDQLSAKSLDKLNVIIQQEATNQWKAMSNDRLAVVIHDLLISQQKSEQYAREQTELLKKRQEPKAPIVNVAIDGREIAARIKQSGMTSR